LLPDMTGAADSVQAQLRDRYVSLTMKVNDSGTSADEPEERLDFGRTGDHRQEQAVRPGANGCLHLRRGVRAEPIQAAPRDSVGYA